MTVGVSESTRAVAGPRSLSKMLLIFATKSCCGVDFEI